MAAEASPRGRASSSPALLIDTDVFVDHLRAGHSLPVPAAYSVITRCELYSGRGVDEELLSLLLSTFRELAVDRRIAELAGRLRRHSGVRTPDALIAASALSHGMALVTRNVKDFRGIEGLRVRDPR